MGSTPEAKARQEIDRLLGQAGWVVQDRSALDLSAGLGVAVREFQLPTGPCDYLLFVDRKAAGVIEAKPEGKTLTGVTDQAETCSMLGAGSRRDFCARLLPCISRSNRLLHSEREVVGGPRTWWPVCRS
jgi:type I site-specific restriction endonuclease